MRTLALVGSAVLVLASGLAAQLSRPGTVIGFRSGSTPLIARQQICTPVQRVCPSGLSSASGWAGGSAYDATDRSVWATQGTRMEQRTIDDCRLICSVPANLTLPATPAAGPVATGLALSENRRELYQTESVPGAAAFHVFHTRSCPPQVIRSCRFALPTPRHVCGAVTVDERTGLVYYAASIFRGVVSPQNTVLVARLADPCNIVCSFPVDTCGNARLGPVTAMAYDACASQLLVSDGSRITVLAPAATTPCTMRPVGCCDLPSTGLDRWHGFDIEPAHPDEVGRSCVGPGCRNCASMRLSAIGDPVVGNSAFGLQLTDAQAGAQAVLAVGIGDCMVPGVPFACGRYHPALGGFALPIGTVGGVGCTGSITAGIPVPNDYTLCDARLCFQMFVICPNMPFNGIALSNAVGIRIDS